MYKTTHSHSHFSRVQVIKLTENEKQQVAAAQSKAASAETAASVPSAKSKPMVTPRTNAKASKTSTEDVGDEQGEGYIHLGDKHGDHDHNHGEGYIHVGDEHGKEKQSGNRTMQSSYPDDDDDDRDVNSGGSRHARDASADYGSTAEERKKAEQAAIKVQAAARGHAARKRVIVVLTRESKTGGMIVGWGFRLRYSPTEHPIIEYIVPNSPGEWGLYNVAH